MPISRLSKTYAPNPRGMPLSTYIGFVKDNNDAQRMGRLSVYIPELGGDPADPGAWVIVGYASPFAGATDPTKIQASSQTMDGSQQSYGMWMIPPDLNNEVAVFFANGDISRGYWFACCYQTNMNHMIPGIATDVTTEPGQPVKTGPVVEYNKANVDSVINPRRPRFDPLSSGLNTEGLISDNERGSASTSARREAPSQVFGFLSPRGNTMHIDDKPDNEFIRLRTRSGAQILIHETTGYVYINSKNGNSWLEISDAGVDVYTAASVSMRAQQDFNVRADRNIIFDANANIFMRAGEKITLAAGTDIQAGAGQNMVLSAMANGTINVGKDFQAKAVANLRLQSGSDMTQLASGKQIRAGSTIFDNCNGAPEASGAVDATGPAGKQAGDAKQSSVGEQTVWKSGAAQIDTIVSRMPTHEPWQPHPNSKVPPPPLEKVSIDAQGSLGGANSNGGSAANGPISDQGCSPGVAGTKKIPTDSFSAITNAASKTGADPATMFAFADIESSFQPAAAAGGGSSASGLFQITNGTYSNLTTKYGAMYNVTPDSVMDPNSNALMAGALINENTNALKANGITNPTPGQVYITHFMGSGAGPKLISAAQNSPDADASLMFPAAAAANPNIFRGKTVSQVYNNLSTTADNKATAYAGQYGLPAPCERPTGAQSTPAMINPASGDASLAALKPNANGYVGTDQQCVSLVKSAAGLPQTALWSKGNSDPSTWTPGQAIATFDDNGTYGNHTDATSHAAIFTGANPDGSLNVIDQWSGHPASQRIIYNDPSRTVVNNASNYAAINVSSR